MNKEEKEGLLELLQGYYEDTYKQYEGAIILNDPNRAARIKTKYEKIDRLASKLEDLKI